MFCKSPLHTGHSRRGFSLIEPTVVILIAGLAAVGVPFLLERSEQRKASEAFKYLAAVRSAQDGFHAEHGHYAADIFQLDMARTPPAYFSVGKLNGSSATGGGDDQNLDDSWSLILTRCGGRASRGYGAYTVSFSQRGFDVLRSSVDLQLRPSVR